MRRRIVSLVAAGLLLVTGGGCGVATQRSYEVMEAPVQPARQPVTGSTAGVGSDRVDCRVAKCIALTFDGGPGRDTPRLLDVLAKEKVKATFFLLGRRHIERHPNVVRRIAREGHEVANHTWSHGRLTELTGPQVYTELARTQWALTRLTGRRPVLMRPPQGRTDPAVSRVSRMLGLAQVLWTVTAKDFSTRDPAVVRRRILAGVQRDGIILLHDIYSGTVPAVPGIVAELKRRGYTIVTVSRLFAPATLRPGRIYRDAWAVRK